MIALDTNVIAEAMKLSSIEIDELNDLHEVPA